MPLADVVVGMTLPELQALIGEMDIPERWNLYADDPKAAAAALGYPESWALIQASAYTPPGVVVAIRASAMSLLELPKKGSVRMYRYLTSPALLE